MQVVTESYRKSDSTERSEEFAARKIRRAKMCEDLGLVAQMESQAIAEEAAIFYGEIVGYELAMWRAFLPTAYEDFAEYSYDVIPEVALEDIVTANNMNIFSTMEIWTPEIARSNSMDPMAVGITGVGRDRRFFPIVRWGAEKLLTLEQIEKTIARRSFDYWDSSLSAVPETILDYIIGKFREKEAISEYGIYRERSGFMGRLKHCGKRMYKVVWDDFSPRKEKVCAECGHTESY